MEVCSLRRGLSVAAVSAVGLLGATGVASAATFTVNDSADAALSTPSSTSCVSTDGGACTLRAAVQAADNAGGASQITVPAGTYTYTIPSTAANAPATGDLDVDNNANLTITGAGAGSTIIDPNKIDRAFAVQSGAALSISGVTIRRAATSAAVAPNDNSTQAGFGGAIYNDGSLSVDSSVLTGDSAVSGGGAVFADTGAGATSITNSTLTSNSSNAEGGALFTEAGTLNLSHDTLTHNSSESEGGVLNDTGTGAVTIDASTISENSADSEGGALYLDTAGALTVSNSTLDHNATADEDGGAIYDDGSSGPLTVSASTFSGDSAGSSQGGAIYASSTNLAVSGSTFTGDEGDYGGALYVDGTSATAVQSVTASTFTDNSATDSYGGAIYDAAGDLQASGSTFTGNTATYDGGAIYYFSAAGLALTNDTFDVNQSIEGGAIYLGRVATTGTIALRNDTITRNTGSDGGGIYDPQNANSIQNTIVADNSGGPGAAGGGDCHGTTASDNAAAADQGGNLDSDGTCFSASVAHDQINVDPMLGQLSDNGGATETDLPLIGSPAIGSALASACPATDQRGVTRSTVQGQCDSGAVQSAPTSLTLANAAPSSSPAGFPFTDTITASDGGPGPSTGTTIVDHLPAGTTLYGATPSQGSCSSAGSPATVTCDLGVVNDGAQATVALVVAPGSAGTLTNIATASDDQGQSINASATTQVTAPAAASTAPASPTVAGPTATSMGTASGSVSRTRADLRGELATGGQPTAYFFQYGRSSHYGQATAVQRTTTPGGVAAKLTGLHYGARYHYRLVAINSTGVSYGADRTFRTASRQRARQVGLSAKRTKADRYTLVGRLRLPHGITRSIGCSGHVTITLSAGGRQLAVHTAKVNAHCTYSSAFTVTGTHARLRARARFGGNPALYGTKSKTVTLG